MHEVGINREDGKVIVAINPDFYRPAEVDLLCGDPSKAEVNLGWTPKTTVQQLAQLMVKFDYDHLKVK